MTGGHGPRIRRALLGTLVVLATAVPATACAGPYQYYDGTGLHDATSAELTGDWKCVEGTRVALRKDGTAVLEKLDGQDFDFDDGWRLSGRGTWRLADSSGGQTVRLRLTDRTRVDRRSPETSTDTPDPTASNATASDPGTSGPEAPSTYSWSFYVDRDKHDAPVLFFFYGDPDIGNTYVMERESAS
ncbi:hypothetical protein AB0467_11920 [Streptomyces sp. NPDC052095]|uniref:hypothetical protein n=1 Tax=unclassified Streptomyces TaxID=2593676 RepID=UPI00344B2710